MDIIAFLRLIGFSHDVPYRIRNVAELPASAFVDHPRIPELRIRTDMIRVQAKAVQKIGEQISALQAAALHRAYNEIFLSDTIDLLDKLPDAAFIFVGKNL